VTAFSDGSITYYSVYQLVPVDRTGTVRQVQVVVQNAGVVQVSVYADVSGGSTPNGATLIAGTGPSNVFAGRNNLTVASPAALSGANVWVTLTKVGSANIFLGLNQGLALRGFLGPGGGIPKNPIDVNSPRAVDMNVLAAFSILLQDCPALDPTTGTTDNTGGPVTGISTGHSTGTTSASTNAAITTGSTGDPVTGISTGHPTGTASASTNAAITTAPPTGTTGPSTGPSTRIPATRAPINSSAVTTGSARTLVVVASAALLLLPT
jgi:hypothetical protein